MYYKEELPLYGGYQQQPATFGHQQYFGHVPIQQPAQNPHFNQSQPNGSASYYYRQQVSSARPRYIPPPLTKIGGNCSGNSGNNSFNMLLNSSECGGRSNNLSPTYGGLTEVLAPYLPGESTSIFMEPKSKQKWRVGKFSRSFLVLFFIFTIIVSCVFLFKNGMNTTAKNYIYGTNVHQESSNSRGEPQPELHRDARSNLGAPPTLENPSKHKSTLNGRIETNANIRTQEKRTDNNVIPEKNFKKQVKIIHSFDEDDGEVNVENLL